VTLASGLDRLQGGDQDLDGVDEEVLQLLDQTDVVQHHRGVVGQDGQDLLVGLGETSVDLVDRFQDAENPLSPDDRDGQDRAGGDGGDPVHALEVTGILGGFVADRRTPAAEGSPRDAGGVQGDPDLLDRFPELAQGLFEVEVPVRLVKQQDGGGLGVGDLAGASRDPTQKLVGVGAGCDVLLHLAQARVEEGALALALHPGGALSF
jgi:hypothetical protein